MTRLRLQASCANCATKGRGTRWRQRSRRQQRMLELRQHVDRDLLAGGPDAARREQFEQEFAEALEQYIKSKNLNQENG